MENNQKIMYWNEELASALSQYDFERMKVCVQNGAFPNDMILHRAINHDRLDIYEYFLYSPEILNHCKINYECDIFGNIAPSFIYASSCGAKNIVKYMIENQHINNFDLPKISQKALLYAGDGGSIEVANLLISHEKTAHYCDFSFEDLKIIKLAQNRARWDFIEYFLINCDIHLMEKIYTEISENQDRMPLYDKKNYKKEAYKIVQARILKEKINNLDVSIENKKPKL